MVEKLTRDLVEAGVQYMGLCCGNRAHMTRKMAETLGRRPPASRFSCDMTQHVSQLKGDANELIHNIWHKTFALDTPAQ